LADGSLNADLVVAAAHACAEATGEDFVEELNIEFMNVEWRSRGDGHGDLLPLRASL
jgi:hypothetical protein